PGYEKIAPLLPYGAAPLVVGSPSPHPLRLFRLHRRVLSDSFECPASVPAASSVLSTLAGKTQLAPPPVSLQSSRLSGVSPALSLAPPYPFQSSAVPLERNTSERLK